MRVLVACEFSQVVTKAFREKEHEAFSCDLLPTEGNSDWHYQCDVLEVLNDGWDMMIAHDPCTYQCNSGVRHLISKEKIWNLKRYALLKESCEFTKKLLNVSIPKICRENPIPHKYAVQLIGRKYDQIIHPYQFGHLEKKATCLWLKNLEPLQETNNVYEEMLKLPKNKSQRIHYLPPSKERGKLRSITYQGIATAMADQWG
ncbi:MAG: hypothetical protein ACFE95_09885 [Candidatus Hodarchaeota archaeon]